MRTRSQSGVTQAGSRLGYLQSATRDITRALLLYRVQVGVALFIAFLYCNKQTIDIVRSLVEGDGWNEIPRLALAMFFALGLMPFVTWYSGRWLSMQDPIKGLREKDFLGWCLRWTPRVCAVLPLLFLAWHLDKYRGANGLNFSLGIVACVLAALAWLVFFAKRQTSEGPAKFEWALKAFRWYWRSALIGLVLVLALIWTIPVWFPQFIGTIPAVLLFFCVFTLCATFLAWRYERAGVPWLLIGFLWTVGWSMTNLTNNHELKLLELRNDLPEQELLEIDFQNWLDAREELWINNSTGKEYPIFIFAVEGGGIYAAQNAAFTLARLEDMSRAVGTEKPFSHNTYAISGISGGSIGAALFVSHLIDKGKKAPDKPIEDAMATILNEDLLSPIAANMFSLDYLQRFIFFYRGTPDRAAALEGAIAAAWKLEHEDRSTLDLPFSELDNGSFKYPALVLNTAEVNSGRTVAAARFRFTTNGAEESRFDNVFEGDGERKTFREILRPTGPNEDLYEPVENCKAISAPVLYGRASDFEKAREPSVLKSAVTSARFPFVSPAGHLMRRGTQKCGAKRELEVVYKAQFVDGGYVEASGTEPALAILRRLNNHVLQLSREPSGKYTGLLNKVKLHLVTVELGNPTFLKASNGGEISTPPLGLLATWSARSKISREETKDYVKSFLAVSANNVEQTGKSTVPTSSYYSAIGGLHRIQPFDAEQIIPLGWRLSANSSALLQKLICSQEHHVNQNVDVKAPFEVLYDLVELTARRDVDKRKFEALCERFSISNR